MNIMRKFFLRAGSLFALIAVGLGAFGSHTLTEAITSEQLNTFEIGVRYQFLHAIIIFSLGSLMYFRQNKLMTLAGWAFVTGIILFSGSLYLLSLSDIFNFPKALLGPITPIGGLSFIIGWALLFISTYQENDRISRRSASREA